MTKEAMKLALEVLRKAMQGNLVFDEAMDAFKALEEALAKQEQGEPVAVWELQESGWETICDGDWLMTLPMGTRLYTTPQQRKPLTNEKIMGIARITCIGISPHEDTLNFVKAIEAAHGIKE
jgi:hypothetical protein